MNKLLDREQIKLERERRGWTQEQLSKVSGIGLRTIQRIEAKGTASLESSRALASVYEVQLDTLWAEEDILEYNHIQTNYKFFIGFLLLAAAIVNIILASQPDMNTVSGQIILFLEFVVLSLLGYVFSTLRISINLGELRWRFGLGVIKKSRRIEDIITADTVGVRWWHGWGIRFLPHCILYNIGGFEAVEIKLKDGECIRLGTDEPQELLRSILTAIEKNTRD